MTVLTPQPKMQFTTAAGVPLSGGKVYTYIAGTTTPQATFTDYTGATPNTNPIILNSRGEANIWLGGALYKFKLTDANDVEIWTVDYISAPTSAVSPVLSGNVIIDSDTPGPALKITQTGTGPVMRVQDSADPDTTPFIIDNAGNVGIGTATPTAQLEATGAAKIGSLTLTSAPLPVASGGTNATTAANARTNLGAAASGAITASGLTMDTARLLGRTTASSGAVEEISVGSGLSLAGGSLTANVNINLGTAQNSTSGTAIDFTSIPSGVRRVTVMFSGVSTNGSNQYLIQLGAGGVQTTGYNSYAMNFGGGSGSGTAETTGFNIRVSSASSVLSGAVVFNLLTGNVWSAQHSFGSSSTTDGYFGAGGVTLSAALDRVRITTVGGTDTFDAGSINISWET